MSSKKNKTETPEDGESFLADLREELSQWGITICIYDNSDLPYVHRGPTGSKNCSVCGGPFKGGALVLMKAIMKSGNVRTINVCADRVACKQAVDQGKEDRKGRLSTLVQTVTLPKKKG